MSLSSRQRFGCGHHTVMSFGGEDYIDRSNFAEKSGAAELREAEAKAAFSTHKASTDETLEGNQAHELLSPEALASCCRLCCCSVFPRLFEVCQDSSWMECISPNRYSAGEVRRQAKTQRKGFLRRRRLQTTPQEEEARPSLHKQGCGTSKETEVEQMNASKSETSTTKRLQVVFAALNVLHAAARRKRP